VRLITPVVLRVPVRKKDYTTDFVHLIKVGISLYSKYMIMRVLAKNTNKEITMKCFFFPNLTA